MSGIYIPGMEMPKRGHTVTLTITGGGEAVAQYYDCKPQLTVPIVYKAVPVPEFSDIRSDPDDVWKKIFSLVVLLLSDREKFDKIKDDVLADLKMMDSAEPNYCSRCVHWWRNKELPCPWDYMFNDDEYYYDCMDFERYEEVQNND